MPRSSSLSVSLSRYGYRWRLRLSARLYRMMGHPPRLVLRRVEDVLVLEPVHHPQLGNRVNHHWLGGALVSVGRYAPILPRPGRYPVHCVGRVWMVDLGGVYG